MDGGRSRLRRLPALAVLAVAIMLTPQSHAACVTPTPSDHGHAPGESAWVGHSEQDLAKALGPPSFSLGRPHMITVGSDYEIDVYAVPEPAREGCIDAYRHNLCGVITAVFCR